MDKLVSVIIPAYNHEKFIKYAIRSIIEQSYKNIELIICNDGSTDNTLDEIKKLENVIRKNVNRYKIINQKNMGTLKTLQKMIHLSAGEYIFILASDDFVDTRIITKLEKKLEENKEIGMCVVDDVIVNESNARVYWDKSRNNINNIENAAYKTFGEYLHKTSKVDFNSNEFGEYNSLYKGNYIPNGYLIRKSILELPGYFCYSKLLDDLHLVLHVSKYSNILFISEPLYFYRWYQNNSIKKTNEINKLKKKTLAYEDMFLKKNPHLLSKTQYNKKYGVLYKKTNFLKIRMNEYIRQNYKFKIIKLFFLSIKFKVKRIF